MENRIKRVLLIASLLATSLYIPTALSQEAVQVIEPDLQRREIQTSALDTEDFEVGFFVGIISIEDFSSNEVYGLRAAYHITEDYFFEAAYGTSEGDLTSFEKLSGGSPLLSDSDRDYTYYNMSVGWNVLPGEVFIGDSYVFNSSFYVIGGIGSTEFAGDDWFTVNIGAGFRLLLNDSIAWHVDVRDHIFDRDTFGEDETTHNMEIHTGFTVFF
ncbi:outer membrane beta-barrel domain-containing protein [Oceanicoccus sagamiensis]|uniref:Outer membrane beta-barrel domain-containing protein n=1 Tax=Oceanicoccus sagamiensis TaxID=716816 RepID=A0A1X9NFK0_9GAMM|nr:outer membrane beta-barrel domain-containing protein [Oceanicoccus sagamiensis]ARN72793.1 outer membrane beta-barrel domain-containing protein [Oceanicoccus sagamiensis]